MRNCRASAKAVQFCKTKQTAVERVDGVDMVFMPSISIISLGGSLMSFASFFGWEQTERSFSCVRYYRCHAIASWEACVRRCKNKKQKQEKSGRVCLLCAHRDKNKSIEHEEFVTRSILVPRSLAAQHATRQTGQTNLFYNRSFRDATVHYVRTG